MHSNEANVQPRQIKVSLNWSSRNSKQETDLIQTFGSLIILSRTYRFGSLDLQKQEQANQKVNDQMDLYPKR
jgi:hypothetical protein